MALINCPECGREISDKSDKCIHCGCPLEIKGNCILNGVSRDLSFLLDDSYSKEYKIQRLEELCDGDKAHIMLALYGVTHNGKIPPTMTILTKEEMAREKRLIEQDSKPHCPKCNSTEIQIVPRKWSLLTGVLTNKVDRVCVNCKYKW